MQNVAGTAAASGPAMPIRAAEYIRMSADHQQYSTANQSEAIRVYASLRGITIVRTYSDDGKSGLRIDGRDGLQRLIEDVETGRADFKTILVYDVSRWGRFQDTDESAYYEYLCRRAGIAVEYCAEQFENDGSPLSAIVKAIKRAMAGEFSRELSIKVFAGQKRLVEKGYWLGGQPGFGLRRLLLDQNGAAKCVLKPGERKSIATDRVILIPGPSEEIETVRRIYDAFVDEGKTEFEIATDLNRSGLTNEYGRPWTRHRISGLLRNEKYIGNSVWNRQSFKLHAMRVQNSPTAWVRFDGAFESVVNRTMFEAAQVAIRERRFRSFRGRPRGLSDEQMLDKLRRLLKAEGHLTSTIINKSKTTPAAATYRRHFGSVARAYGRIGFVSARRYKERTPLGRPRGLSDAAMLDALRRLWKEHGYLTPRLINASKSVPASGSYALRFGSIARAYRLIGYVQDPRRRRPRRILRPSDLSDAEMLDTLRKLLRERGELSVSIIDESPSVPSHGSYLRRFGSIRQLYRLVGYAPANFRRLPGHGQDFSDEEMLDHLRGLLSECGDLTAAIIDADKERPSSRAYIQRFGGLKQAYKLIGFSWVKQPGVRPGNQSQLSNDELLEALRNLWRARGHLSQQIVNKDRNSPSAKLYNKRFGGLTQAYRLIGFTPKFRRKAKR
jgi:DNA invertase Pin-like site-specific DNA recombinase